MTQQWVDFNELKQRVSIADVLVHYHLLETLRPVKGEEELIGPCPFHQGRSRDSFHASVAKNAFNCMNQKCGKHGNILDFVAHEEGVDIRQAALLIDQWFPVGAPAAQGAKKERQSKVLSLEPVNPPLTFPPQGFLKRLLDPPNIFLCSARFRHFTSSLSSCGYSLNPRY